MKNLKITSFIIIALAMLTSCSQFVQLIETESIGKDAVSKNGVCENEEIKVTYDMWSEDGITYFSIFNKTDKPMYIDWKRSVFIYNDWKNVYWVEKSTTESYLVPSGTGNNITYERKQSTVVAERYTFIPPKTYISVPMTYTIMSGYYSTTDNTGKTTKTMVSQSIKKNGGTKVSIASTTGKGNVKAWEKSFSQDNTVSRFRNFITYASKENFSDEKFIENEFYVNKITEMSTKNFNGKYKNAKITAKVGSLKSKAKVKVFESPYRAGTSFYNTILK
jgi:hypothetical protein